MPCDAIETSLVGQLSTLRIVATLGSQKHRQYAGRCFLSMPTTRFTIPPERPMTILAALHAISELRKDLPLS